MNTGSDVEPPGGGPSPLRFFGLGFELVTPLLVGLFGGRWLDRRFGTEPWLQLVGALLGATTGMVAFVREVMPRDGSGGAR